MDAEYGSGAANQGADALPFDETKSTLATIIRDVIASFGDQPFTKGDVLARLKNSFPTLQANEASVASFLARMGKSEKLKIVQPGAGKSPARYQNPPAQPPTLQEVL